MDKKEWLLPRVIGVCGKNEKLLEEGNDETIWCYFDCGHVLFGLALYGCATQSSKPMTAKELVAQARKTVSEVSVSTAKEALDRGGYLFLDSREPREYKMGHIPGAINIPRGLIEFKVTKKIPDKNTKILVYCKFGGRGCLTACTLCRMGYRHVANIAGGW
ncbi:MAG: hypothetical protein DRG63_06950, partial [Deltaproteobacteria bacterium]